MAGSVKISAADVRAALRDRYVQGEYAVLFEVTDATGARHTRSADAVVMSCWPSRGLELWGMEIKVSRADWMHERRQPAKAETIAAYCDRWYLVTGPGVVADVSEIPPAWGWLELAPPASDVGGGRGKPRLQLRKEATKTDAKPADRLFLAAVLRNASRIGAGVEEAMRQSVRAEQEALIEERVQKELARRRERGTEVFEAVEAFERETGIRLDAKETWTRLSGDDGRRVGRMVNALVNSHLDASWGVIAQAVSAVQRAGAELEKVAQELGVGPPPVVRQMRRKRA